MFFISTKGNLVPVSPAVEKEFYELLKCFPTPVEVIAIAHPREGGKKRKKKSSVMLQQLDNFSFSPQNHADSYYLLMH